MAFVKEAKLLMKPYYAIGFIMSLSYCVLKTTWPLCDYLFDGDCELDVREYEVLIFLACVIAVKNKRQPSLTAYMSTILMFAKLANLIMFARANPLYAAAYLLVWIAQHSFVHEPVYSGPDSITYFRGPEFTEYVLNGDRRITWLIQFYAAWSPPCVAFAPVFAELSHKYGLENLCFGKVDVNAFPNVAERFHVNASSWANQLPTLLLIQNGREVDRRPAVDAKGKVQKFTFGYEHVLNAFGLNEVYNQCRRNPMSRKAAAVTAQGDVIEDKKTL